jgi:hypothetical protein
MKFIEWLPALLPLVLRLREALWWFRKRYVDQHTFRKKFATNWEWNEILWLNGKLDRLDYLYKTHLTVSLLPDCCSQYLFMWIPSLGLNFRKKQISHATNLQCCIYEDKEIIFGTSLITKKKSDIVASNSLSTSILNCKNKSAIKRSILEKKWKIKK